MCSSRTLNWHELYELTDPLSRRSLRLMPDSSSEWLSTEQAWGLARGRIVRTEQPLVLRGYMGGQPTHVLWGTPIAMVCVSDWLVGFLRLNEFTAWGTYRVSVLDRSGESLPGYSGWSILGPKLPRDRKPSTIITKPPPTPQGRAYQVYKGLYFDPTAWDGSDFFWINGHIAVTKRVRDAFRKAKIANVQFVPLDEVEIDVKLDEFAK